MHQVKLRFSEPLVREAVRAFVLRTFLRRLGVSFFLAVALIILMLAWLVANHDRSWLVGFLAAFVLFVIVLVPTVYLAHFRNTIGRFRQMRSPEATLQYDEQNIGFDSFRINVFVSGG